MKTEQEIREKMMVRESLAFRPPRLEFHSEVTPRMVELGREMERTLIMGAIREAGCRRRYCEIAARRLSQGVLDLAPEKPLHPGESGV
jgi:hypothetical protein